VNLKPACLLLCLAHAHPVAALGLGDLAVRSALGQPLHATVTIIAPGVAGDADCFALQPAADAVSVLPRTQLELERHGDQALLHIRSAQAVDEPILQFTVATECDVRLQRDYVVLLDPPAIIEPPAAIGSHPAADDVAPVAAPAPARPAKRNATAAAPARTAAAVRKRAPAPRLVLSGRRLAGAGPDGLALRLDIGLPDLDRPRAHAEALTATELSDENTALTRKLAHLEARLAELQQRNTELETRRQPSAADRNAPVVDPPHRSGSPEWPLYLLLAGFIFGAAILLIAWMRRRNRAGTTLVDAGWQTRPPLPRHDPGVMDERVDAAEPDLPIHDASASPMAGHEPQARSESMFGLPAVDGNPEVKDDILDQAEVFMAHGHGDFAIHLLQEHLRETPDESPVPWLLLLDLLHRNGDEAGYAAASTQCRRHYNIDLTQPPVSQDAEGPGLEAYPHVMDRVVQMWPSAGIEDFLRDLVYDDRGGTRVGFEPGAYRDILLLRAIVADTRASH
jgi:Tfp pilus assembly protein FimV